MGFFQRAELPVNGHDLEGAGCFLRRVDLKGPRLAVKTDHMSSKWPSNSDSLANVIPGWKTLCKCVPFSPKYSSTLKSLLRPLKLSSEAARYDPRGRWVCSCNNGGSERHLGRNPPWGPWTGLGSVKESLILMECAPGQFHGHLTGLFPGRHVVGWVICRVFNSLFCMGTSHSEAACCGWRQGVSRICRISVWGCWILGKPHSGG